MKLNGKYVVSLFSFPLTDSTSGQDNALMQAISFQCLGTPSTVHTI